MQLLITLRFSYLRNICIDSASVSKFFIFALNCIGSVIASVLTSCVVDREFEPKSDQTKDYEIGICFFYT